MILADLNLDFFEGDLFILGYQLVSADWVYIEKLSLSDLIKLDITNTKEVDDRGLGSSLCIGEIIRVREGAEEDFFNWKKSSLGDDKEAALSWGEKLEKLKIGNTQNQNNKWQTEKPKLAKQKWTI